MNFCRHFKACLIETLQDLFGEASIQKVMKSENLQLTIHEKLVDIDLTTLDVVCAEDEKLRDMVHTAVNKLYQVLVQVQ